MEEWEHMSSVWLQVSFSKHRMHWLSNHIFRQIVTELNKVKLDSFWRYQRNMQVTRLHSLVLTSFLDETSEPSVSSRHNSGDMWRGNLRYLTTHKSWWGLFEPPWIWSTWVPITCEMLYYIKISPNSLSQVAQPSNN